MQAQLGDLLAQSKNAETQLATNDRKKRDYESELSSVMTQTQSESRITKGEVEDAVRAAERMCKERDGAAKNLRLTEIPKMIKELEEKVRKRVRPSPELPYVRSLANTLPLLAPRYAHHCRFLVTDTFSSLSLSRCRSTSCRFRWRRVRRPGSS